MPKYLMRIVVNEQQHEKKLLTCKAILSYLWEQGAPGATMRRGDAGIDYEGNIEYDILEDAYFNDLPIIIESIMDAALIKKMGVSRHWLNMDRSAYQKALKNLILMNMITS